MPEIFNASNQAKKKDQVTQNSADAPSTTKKRHSVDEYSEIMRQEKPQKNYLASFLPKPFKIGFDTQMDGEQIVLVLRQHPITLIKKVATILVMLLMPIILPKVSFVDFFPLSYQSAMVLGWYTITLGFALETFLVWFFSVFIITDERIIDVDFLSLLFKDISSAKIDAIQDISSKTGGMLATVVDYGTVYIQTAGEKTEIQFENVPQPAKVAAILNELLLEEEKEKIEGRVR
ncbi:MAG: hypothetical protein ACOZAK_04205 [Patescibacteria group bacterium]